MSDLNSPGSTMLDTHRLVRLEQLKKTIEALYALSLDELDLVKDHPEVSSLQIILMAIETYKHYFEMPDDFHK